MRLLSKLGCFFLGVFGMAYVGRQYLGWSFPAFTFMGDDAAGGLVPPDVAEEISPTAEKNPFAAEEQPEEQRRCVDLSPSPSLALV